MQSAEELNSEDTGHYWPDGLIPVTPQARQYGYVFDVYVTPHVWKNMCVWSQGHGTHTDKRLFELLDSCYNGLAKSMAKADDFVAFTFKHFYKKKNLKAKKRGQIKMGARLLRHPETDEPWLLLFNPEYDFKDQLKKGEPPNVTPDTDDTTRENRVDESPDGMPGSEPRPIMDPAN